MKLGYKTMISQTSDGNVVARIGCLLFVGEPQDLQAVTAYYEGKILKEFKPFTRSIGSLWMGDNTPPDTCEKNESRRVYPHELTGSKPTAVVTKADNGYVIRRGNVDVVFKADTEVAKVLDSVFKDLAFHLGLLKDCEADRDNGGDTLPNRSGDPLEIRE